MIKFKVDIDLDIGKLNSKKTLAKKAAQMQLDQDVLKDSNYFIPVADHNLEGSGVRASKIGKGEVAWDTAYARRLYYNPQYNFSKDKNPNARGLWFEAAKAQYLNNWLKNIDNYYGLFFDGK